MWKLDSVDEKVVTPYSSLKQAFFQQIFGKPRFLGFAETLSFSLIFEFPLIFTIFLESFRNLGKLSIIIFRLKKPCNLLVKI